MERKAEGERLRILIRQSGLTQSEVARLAHVRPATVTAWVQGTHRPAGRSLVRLAAALGVDVHALAFYLRTGTQLKRTGKTRPTPGRLGRLVDWAVKNNVDPDDALRLAIDEFLERQIDKDSATDA